MGGRSLAAVFRHRTSISCCLSILTLVITAQTQPSPRSTHTTLGETVSVIQLRVPEKARTQLMQALDEYRRNHVAKSLQHANAALAIFPGFPNALTLRGYIELAQQDFQAARTDFEQALDADPHFVSAYLYLAATLNRLGRYDDALQQLDRHMELAPNQWETYFEMSKAWMGKQDYARTLDTIDQASLLGAETEVAAAVHFVRGRALAGLHRYAPAKAEFQVALSRQSTGAMADLTRELISQMDRDSALAAK